MAINLVTKFQPYTDEQFSTEKIGRASCRERV